MNLERRQLAAADRADLGRRVRWVAAEDGDGAGYDFCPSIQRARAPDGGEDHERVCPDPFFLTRNECDLAKERPAEWRIYRVHLFAKEPRVFTIAPPLELSAVNLRPEIWRASFYSRAEEKRQ